jgi:hypothetical protein
MKISRYKQKKHYKCFQQIFGKNIIDYYELKSQKTTNNLEFKQWCCRMSMVFSKLFHKYLDSFHNVDNIDENTWNYPPTQVQTFSR